MIKLLVPDMPTADELLPYLRKIDETKIYSNRGPLVRELEDRLGFQIGADAVTVSNATIGLETVIRALRLPRGSNILVPALTFVASAQAIWNTHMRPVFCDVDPNTWQMTPETALAGEGGAGFRAAMPVATFGDEVPTQPWAAFSDAHLVPVVIDAAGAILSQPVSRHPRLTTVFSLHATKAIGAGEGGAVAAFDNYILERVRSMSSFGHWGTNAKMSEYSAAVALASISRIPSKLGRMASIAARYAERLPAMGCTMPRPPRAEATLLCVCLPDNVTAALIGGVLTQAGIMSKQWYRPFPDELQQFSGCQRAYALPVTERLRTQVIGLPYHSSLTVDDVDTVCDCITKAINA